MVRTPSGFPPGDNGRGVASARQLKRRARAYGWCRAQRAHERNDGINPSQNEVKGRWGPIPHRPVLRRENIRSNPRDLGTGGGARRQLNRKTIFGNAVGIGICRRNHYGCATAMQEYSFGQRRRTRNLRAARTRGFEDDEVGRGFTHCEVL
jgi:hypothetical protein